MKELFDLKGKKALITGSSRGIGKAIAIGLADYGADVIVHYTERAEEAEKVVQSIQGAGGKALALKKNLMEPDCADAIFHIVEREFAGIDILILNASIQYKKPWEEITLHDFDDQMAINVRASLALIQKAVPYMKKNKWGRIVTVGSVQEYKPHPHMLVYSASKAAQTMMARSLAAQLALHGITVNNICPGVILTDRNKAAYLDEVYRKEVTGSIPAGYWGKPEDCVGGVLLLCSDAGRYITGESLLIDGGKAL
jgi:NAD(P)-dependent dehydrogenase (short-subunit alcohol dehydrogenase family)